MFYEHLWQGILILGLAGQTIIQKMWFLCGIPPNTLLFASSILKDVDDIITFQTLPEVMLCMDMKEVEVLTPHIPSPPPCSPLPPPAMPGSR